MKKRQNEKKYILSNFHFLHYEKKFVRISRKKEIRVAFFGKVDNFLSLTESNFVKNDWSDSENELMKVTGNIKF